MDIHDNRLVWMPEDQVINQNGFVQMHHDRWFIVHPETSDLLFFQSDKRRIGQLRGASPQCNSSKSVIEHIQQKMFPWAGIKFFKTVACPIRIEDYT